MLRSQGIGRGHLVPSQPGPQHDESDLVDGELRKEDLVWSEHEFNDGDRENRRVLRQFLGVKVEVRTM